MSNIPHSREAEESVIGSVFINRETYYEVSRVLSPDDFYIIRHQWIWQAIKDRAEKNQGIDLLTISDDLKKAGKLEELGGPSYLTTLINRVPSSLHAMEYSLIVRDMAQRRIGINKANDIATRAYDLASDFSLENEALSFIGLGRGASRRIETTDAAREMADLIDNPDFCSTGIGDIDSKIGGLFKRELSILAGVQGTGKSAAKWQGAKYNARIGKKVLLCDLEMTAAQTWFRAACGDLGIDVNSLRSGRAGREEIERVKRHAQNLAEEFKNSIVIYNAPMTPADILSAAILERPDIIYVDVLKNLAGKPARENEISWYDFVLNFLRINVAQNKAINAHVQVLHHINRSAGREDRKPTMQDLKYAGESDADNVFLLHREKKDYDVTSGEQVKTVVPICWIVDKSRFGWTGEEEINFNLLKQSFYGMSRAYRNEQEF